MKINTLSLVVPVVALAAVTLAATPASADQRGRRESGSRSAPQSAPAPRAVPMGRAPTAPAPRNIAPQRSLPAPQSIWRGGIGREQPRVTAPQSIWRGIGREQPRAAAPQSIWRGDVRRVEPRVVSPQGVFRGDIGRVAPRGISPQRAVAVRRSFPVFVPRSHFVRFAPLYRPYYFFRPRFRLSIGLFVGYPTVYPSYWYDPGWYYAPPVSVDGYGYGDYGVSAAPEAAYGGISFDITPANAAVFVDGTYVGTVADFSSTNPPLTVAIGTHHIEIRAQGYETLAFDADVNAREVVPYQGTLQVIR